MTRTATLLLAVVASMTAAGYDRITGDAFASRSEVIATHGMAATSQPLATQVALDILKAGGSAVDAAIAANATLGLMEPTGSGIGGDLFAIVWDAENGELAGLNASGHSPQSLSLQYFREQGLTAVPYLGPLPVGSMSPRVAFAAMAASTALPPAFRMSRATCVASGWLVAAMPCVAITSDRDANASPVIRS